MTRTWFDEPMMLNGEEINAFAIGNFDGDMVEVIYYRWEMPEDAGSPLCACLLSAEDEERGFTEIGREEIPVSYVGDVPCINLAGNIYMVSGRE